MSPSANEGARFSMPKHDGKSPLHTITIAKPCPMDWEKMTGDERIRFCGSCKLNVYNLSAMKEDEAVQLVREKEGKLCVRFFRRPDGTILTQDCPTGLKMWRQQFWRMTSAIAAGFAAVFLYVANQVHANQDSALYRAHLAASQLGRYSRGMGPARYAAPSLENVGGGASVSPPMVPSGSITTPTGEVWSPNGSGAVPNGSGALPNGSEGSQTGTAPAPSRTDASDSGALWTPKTAPIVTPRVSLPRADSGSSVSAVMGMFPPPPPQTYREAAQARFPAVSEDVPVSKSDQEVSSPSQQVSDVPTKLGQDSKEPQGKKGIMLY